MKERESKIHSGILSNTSMSTMRIQQRRRIKKGIEHKSKTYRHNTLILAMENTILSIRSGVNCKQGFPEFDHRRYSATHTQKAKNRKHDDDKRIIFLCHHLI